MKTRIKIENLVFGALLMSMAVVLKLFLTISTPLFRLSLFEFPVLLSGLFLGPFAALVGIGTDLVYTFINPHGVTLNPIFTIEAMVYGLIPGVYFYFFKYKLHRYAIVLAITLILAFAINTYGLYVITGFNKKVAFSTIPIRALRDLGKYFIHLFLIHSFASNKNLHQFSVIKRTEHFIDIE